ncbi:EAL domain-containing protein [Kluyvera ascorbata]
MKKVWFLNFFTPIVTTMAILVTANCFIVNDQKKQQFMVTESYLKYATRVSEQLASALKEAKGLNVYGCSKEDLAKLMGIRIRHNYVDDIGVIKNNHIFCTAVWGVTTGKYSLPEHYYLTHDGFKLYNLGFDSKYMKSMQSASVSGSYIVMPSSNTFPEYQIAFPGYSVEISMDDGGIVFYKSEVNSKLKSKIFNYFFGVENKNCNINNKICVETYNANGGFRALSWPIILLVVLLGATLGWLLSQSLQAEFNRRKSMENRLIKAIKYNNFFMMYQPIIRSGDRSLVSLESLARWRDNVLGTVSPDVFINLAESIGAYSTLSRIIVDKVIQDLSTHLINDEKLVVSINIADEDIKDDNYLPYLFNQCQAKGIKPKQVKLEITERCKSSYIEISIFCNAAKNYGMLISLDDFGTGSSNIDWLTKLKFDEVKIDKYLVNFLSEERENNIIISIIDELKKNKKNIVFEGVEKQDQFNKIRGMDPNFLIQGWYTGKPMLSSEIRKFIDSCPSMADG